MKRISVALLLSAVTASAFAADERFYIGANGGQSSTQYPGASLKTGTAATVMAGIQLSENFAIEAQIGDLGSFTLASGKSAKTTVYSLVIVGIVPLSERWAGYAKFGDQITHTKFDAGAVSAGGYTSTRDTPTGGFGVLFNVNSAIRMRLGYDVYGIGDSSTYTAKTSVISAGAAYRF